MGLKQFSGAPILRLWVDGPTRERPDETQPRLWAGMRLSEFWAAFVKTSWLPSRAAAAGARPVSARTLDEDESSMRKWIALTSDPPLFEIGDEHTSRFLIGLRETIKPRGGKMASSRTVRKHVTFIQMCLNLAGPRTALHPQAQRLLDEVPFIGRVRLEKRETNDVFTREEIERIVRACRTARLPAPEIEGVAQAEWWVSYVLVAYHTGERWGAMTRVRFDNWLPATADAPRGVLLFPAAIRKGTYLHEPEDNYVPLHPQAADAIEKIRTARERIFDWPHSASWFCQVWHRILAAAEIPLARRFGTHSLRKAVSNDVDEIDDGVGSMLLAHGADVNERHYRDSQRKRQLEAARKAKAVQRLAPLAVPGAERQLSLFDRAAGE